MTKNSPEEFKSEYIILENGEIIKYGDEYNSNGKWNFVPDFLVGQKVQYGSTKWRRLINSPCKPSKGFLSFFKKVK